MKRRLTRLLHVADAALRIGLADVVRVARYRLRLKSGALRKALPEGQSAQGPLFGIETKDEPCSFSFALFGWLTVDLSSPPDWFLQRLAAPDQPLQRANATDHFTQIADFSPALGDIKGVWELARLDFAPQLALRSSKGAPGAATLLACLVDDFVAKNPPNLGVHWKCAQEVSLRVLNILLAWQILGKASGAGLQGFLRSHLARIAPTISYAIGQQNNHASSEAAALYCGGLALESLCPDDQAARGYKELGRTLLEKAAVKLVNPDGSFAQYSLTYTRVFLATMAISEAMRRAAGEAPFSRAATDSLARCALFFDTLVSLAASPEGAAPLVGASDGAHVLNAEESAYHDMRNVRNAALFLFTDAACGRLPALVSSFLGENPSRPATSAVSRIDSMPMLLTARAHGFGAALRLPTYRFRPSQADCLHLDLWHEGRPLLVDGGTQSYYDEALNRMLAGAGAHNTAMFDGTDPMPRISRFLFARWLKVDAFMMTPNGFSARYHTRQGAIHERSLTLHEGGAVVTDCLCGRFTRASIGFRLGTPAHLTSDGLCGEAFSLRVVAPQDAIISLNEAPDGALYGLRASKPQMIISINRGLQEKIVVTTHLDLT